MMPLLRLFFSALLFILCASQGVAQAAEPAKKESDKKPKLRFTIGKETTFVTGPLDADGRPDCAAALNEMLGKGVTKDNNANVLLWKAIGPKPEGSSMPPEYFKLLGMEEPPEKGDYFIDMSKFVRDQFKGDKDKQDDILQRQASLVTRRPWQAQDHPEILAWLTANEKPLALAIEASKRTHYFCPLVPTKTEKGSSGLVGALLPGAQKSRNIAQALAARAMLRLAEGKTEEAWRDLFALHRLSRLVGRGGCLIELLVGIAMDGIASRAELAFLDRAQLDGPKLERCIKDLNALPPLSTTSEKIALTERITFIDIVMMVDRGGLSYLESMNGKPRDNDPISDALLKAIDWDPALRDANRWYDRLIECCNEKNREKRARMIVEITQELKSLKADGIDWSDLLKKVGEGEDAPKVLGKKVGNILISLLLPAFHKVRDAEDRAHQTSDNLHIAFALARYRLDHEGKYPKQLDDLAPKYLKEVPLDVFSGKPLIYQQKGRGYLFYSVGVNGKDDDGKGPEEKGDDLGVKMPFLDQQ